MNVGYLCLNLNIVELMLGFLVWAAVLVHLLLMQDSVIVGTCYENRGGDAGSGDGEDPSCYG